MAARVWRRGLRRRGFGHWLRPRGWGSRYSRRGRRRRLSRRGTRRGRCGRGSIRGEVHGDENLYHLLVIQVVERRLFRSLRDRCRLRRRGAWQLVIRCHLRRFRRITAIELNRIAKPCEAKQQNRRRRDGFRWRLDPIRQLGIRDQRNSRSDDRAHLLPLASDVPEFTATQCQQVDLDRSRWNGSRAAGIFRSLRESIIHAWRFHDRLLLGRKAVDGGPGRRLGRTPLFVRCRRTRPHHRAPAIIRC